MNVLGPEWSDRRVLDCYAGTGAFGFEALSRGASTVAFIEKNSAACARLHKTGEALGVTDRIAIHKGDAIAVLARLSKRRALFDVLFFDPPYQQEVLDKALTLAQGLAAPGATIVAEHAPETQLADALGGLPVSDRRRYGSTAITMYSEASE